MGVHGVILATIYSIMAVAGIVGNTFLITAVCLSMKLRTATNVFVVSLSAVDIINSICLIVQVIALAGVRTNAFMLVCTIVGPSAVMLLGASSLLLTLIAMCRYVLITKKPHTFKRVFSKRKMATMVAFSFIIPIVLVTLFLVLGLATAGLNEDTICTFYDSPIFNIVCGCIMLVLLLVVCVFYTKIFLFIRRHFRQLHNQKSAELGDGKATPSRSQSVKSRESPANEAARVKNHNMELESTITKNMVFVLCVFALCFLPLAFALIFSESAWLGAYFFAIFNLSSCLNPLLFGWKHPVFRHVFTCMFKGKLEDIEEPASWLRKCQHRSEF